MELLRAEVLREVLEDDLDQDAARGPGLENGVEARERRDVVLQVKNSETPIAYWVNLERLSVRIENVIFRERSDRARYPKSKAFSHFLFKSLTVKRKGFVPTKAQTETP